MELIRDLITKTFEFGGFVIGIVVSIIVIGMMAKLVWNLSKSMFMSAWEFIHKESYNKFLNKKKQKDM